MTVRPPTRLFPAGHFFSRHEHLAPKGVSVEDLVKSDYWQHVVGIQVAKHHVIEVVAEDNTFEATFRVLSAVKGAVVLRLIGYAESESAAAEISSRSAPPAPVTPPPAVDNIVGGLKVEFIPQHKWRVTETGTKDVVSKGHATKDEAELVRSNLLAARKAA